MGEANERTNEREKEERTKDRIEVEEEGVAFHSLADADAVTMARNLLLSSPSKKMSTVSS